MRSFWLLDLPEEKHFGKITYCFKVKVSHQMNHTLQVLKVLKLQNTLLLKK